MNRAPDEAAIVVVVALTDPALPHLAATLARLAREAGEVVIVDASGTPEASRLAARHPNVRVIAGPAGRLAPGLWRDGLLATDAPLVAFTTASMMPSRGWLEALRSRMAETGAAGVGGPIEPGPALSSTDRAVALLRYSNYFPRATPHPDPLRLPLPPGEGRGEGHGASGGPQQDTAQPSQPTGHAPHPRPLSRGERGGRFVGEEREADGGKVEPPGDNALYRRDRLLEVESSWVDGFWEVDVHQALRAEGYHLAMADDGVVRFVGGGGLGSMAAQRFRHGRRYGLGRSLGLGPMQRWARVVAAPLVPPLLGLRAWRALQSRGMAPSRSLAALPALLALASAWAIGEAVGTATGGKPHRPDSMRVSAKPRTREAA